MKPELAAPIKAMIEESSSFGYRTVTALLGMNKNTVQRISISKAGSEEACHRTQTPYPSLAIGRDDPERALVDRSVP